MNARLPIPQGSILLTPRDARMLYQAARIGELRTRNRIGDSALYKLLTDLSMCAFTTPADNGNLTRQDAASEDREMWTVAQLARTTGRAARTIRLDIENNALPAHKQGNTWVITKQNAHTYIASRRQN